ncbi:MAG: helix-turn-helix domain-containing protein [Calditrichaeota bacterium]|nr:MAG: helix-turn-helix domain-containing protein [Calditrichota bacterium]
MAKAGVDHFVLEGPGGSLKISADDEVARKLAMLIEGKCLGLGATRAAQKYGYTKQRYFQLLHAFEEQGSAALVSKKKGPKSNYVRTENAVSQVLRHRFLDLDANAAVIAQKMNQTGIKISQRSVERILSDHGLQKKSSTSSGQKMNRRKLKSSIPKSGAKK